MLEQLGERRDVRRQLIASQVADRAFSPLHPHHAVVIEHGNAIGGQPHVALEAVRAETKCQLKGIDRVLAGVRSGAPMGERDRVFEE